MKTLASFCQENSAAIIACLNNTTKQVLLLLDQSATVLDCNQPFLELISRAEKPLASKLSELLIPGNIPVLPVGDACGRMKLNFRDGQGETQTLECLLYSSNGFTLLLGERSMLLQSSAVTSISGLNDELVNVTRELQKKKAALEDAMAKVRTLEGMLPICASCKKIRDDKGEWQPVEKYIKERTNTNFSHGICPVCEKKLYPGFAD